MSHPTELDYDRYSKIDGSFLELAILVTGAGNILERIGYRIERQIREDAFGGDYD